MIEYIQYYTNILYCSLAEIGKQGIIFLLQYSFIYYNIM